MATGTKRQAQYLSCYFDLATWPNHYTFRLSSKVFRGWESGISSGLLTLSSPTLVRLCVSGSGTPADERLVLSLFSPFVNQDEIANLPAYSYYVRIAAINAQEPMSGVTVVVEHEGSETIARRVTESSQQLYAKKIEDENAVEKSKAQPKKQTKTKGSKPVTKKGDDLSDTMAIRP